MGSLPRSAAGRWAEGHGSVTARPGRSARGVDPGFTRVQTQRGPREGWVVNDFQGYLKTLGQGDSADAWLPRGRSRSPLCNPGKGGSSGKMLQPSPKPRRLLLEAPQGPSCPESSESSPHPASGPAPARQPRPLRPPIGLYQGPPGRTSSYPSPASAAHWGSPVSFLPGKRTGAAVLTFQGARAWGLRCRGFSCLPG